MAASLAVSTSTTTKAMKNDYHDDPLYINFIICLKTHKTKKLDSHFLINIICQDPRTGLCLFNFSK